MLIKPICKRGIKNTEWLDKFVASKLQNDAWVIFTLTPKMEYALNKYCRSLDVYRDRYTIETERFYNCEKYSIHIYPSYYGKYECRITDTEKMIEFNIEKRYYDFITNVNNKNISEHEKLKTAEWIRIDAINNYDPFPFNFVEKVYKKISNERIDYSNMIAEFM